VQEPDAGVLSDPVTKKLLTCLEQFSAKKKIVPDDNLELDLGLDSLARLELVVSIEKSFGTSLPDSFGAEVFTVKDAALKLKEHLSAGWVPTRERVRIVWADILTQEPSEDVAASLLLASGPFWNAILSLGTHIIRFLFRVYGRLSVRGVENLPEHGPYIIAPNHLSLVDAPSVVAAVSWKVASQTFFLGSTDYFGGPLASRIAGLIHVIPVDMDTRLASAMQLSAYVLRRGNILCVFPEGSRSRDGGIKEFKKGVGIIAKELNVPVVPVAIRGTYEMLAPGRKFPRPARISVTFGKPLVPGDLDYDGLVKKLYEEVVRMLEEEK